GGLGTQGLQHLHLAQRDVDVPEAGAGSDSFHVGYRPDRRHDVLLCRGFGGQRRERVGAEQFGRRDDSFVRCRDDVVHHEHHQGVYDLDYEHDDQGVDDLDHEHDDQGVDDDHGLGDHDDDAREHGPEVPGLPAGNRDRE